GSPRVCRLTARREHPLAPSLRALRLRRSPRPRRPGLQGCARRGRPWPPRGRRRGPPPRQPNRRPHRSPHSCSRAARPFLLSGQSAIIAAGGRRSKLDHVPEALHCLAPMTELPTGTVTFLFTDVEGSTRLMQELGDGYSAVHDDHAAIVRRSVAEGGGVEVSTEGDSFFVVFASPAGAVR